MNYHFYLHDDLDGTASGAVFLHFLKNRGGDMLSYNPIDFSDELNKQWVDYIFKTPFVILDFRYHPKANWWVDHHGSSFLQSKWQDEFKNDKQHYFNSQAKSACGLVLNLIEKDHGYIFPEFIKRLARGIDMVDSASWPKVEDVFDLGNPIRRLALIIDEYNEGDESKRAAFREEALRTLSEGDYLKFIGQEKFNEISDEFKVKTQEGIAYVKSLAKLFENVVFINTTELSSGSTKLDIRFIPNLLFREQQYLVSLSKADDGAYIVRTSKNPWNKSKTHLNIGQMLHLRNAMWGGHDGIGVMRFDSEDEALNEAEKMVDFLNKNG